MDIMDQALHSNDPKSFPAHPPERLAVVLVHSYSAWALAGTCAVAGVVGGAGGPRGQMVFLRSSAALAVAENHLCWLVVTLRKTTNVVSRNSVGRWGKPPGG